MRISRKILAVIALIQGLVGFAQPVLAEKVLKRSVAFAPQPLDLQSTSSGQIGILLDLFEGLITTASDGTSVPGMAERWEVSEDGKTYTFFLRENAKWSNGDPVTAKDFVYAWRRMASADTGSAWASMVPIKYALDVFQKRKAPEDLGIKADGDYKLIVTLNAPIPTSSFLSFMSHSCLAPLHQKTVEAHGDEWALPENIVVNGPFTLDLWEPQILVKLKKNQSYWNAADVKPDAVVFYTIKTYQDELAKFKVGSLHITSSIPEEDLSEIKTKMLKDYRSGPLCEASFCALNMRGRPLNVHTPQILTGQVRQALTLAIDRNKLTTQYPAYGLVPIETEGYVCQDLQCKLEIGSVSCKNLLQVDKEALAHKLFQTSGYPSNQPLRVLICPGQQKEANIVADMWRSVLGMKVQVVSKDSKDYLLAKEKKEYDVIFQSWKADVPYSFLQRFKSNTGILNVADYNSPTYDEALDRAANIRDPQERSKSLMKAEQELLNAWAICPLWHGGENLLLSEKVKDGFTPNRIAYHPSRWIEVVDE